MAAFTDAELTFLRSARLLGRIATVSTDGMPHVTPVGWGLAQDGTSIEVGGRDMEKSKKFRDVASTGRAALVIDEVLPPWRPRGIEIRGRAEVVMDPQPLIRIHPERVRSWGLTDAPA
jgi:pyridoxamine 5'-phosphate oxidase family protein